MSRILFIAFAIIVSGCGGTPKNCFDGCVDVCRGKHFSNCAQEYNAGYKLGYQDGLQRRTTFGVNSDAYVAGYYDGLADGQATAQALDGT